MLLVSDVLSRVKRQFGDEVGAQITDVDLIKWINDAQREIALQNDLLQTISTLPTIVNTQDYTLPTDLLRLRGVRYDKVRLSMITMDDIDKVTEDRTLDKGPPLYYWTFANTLSLWPTPDAIKTITIYYTQVPAQLYASDALSLPDQYDNRVVEYCIAQAAELDDDLEHYQLKMSQFQQGIDAFKGQSEQTDESDTYPFMTYDPNEYV